MNVYQFTVDRRVSGDKLNVYLTGTTTAATFYTDAAGTTTGTSPLTADAAGQFPPIYLDPAITYRIKVTNSAGSTTYSDIDPVRLTDEGTADGVLTLRSIDDAKKRTIPANVSAVYCAGYANKGDRGQALYARVASNPTHAGKFTSADGAFWELSENLLNPFMFGAKGDDTTNDSAAIQAMFDFLVVKAKPYPVDFMGAKFYVHDAITLPKVAVFTHLDIGGGGATLRTDQAITILGNAVPANQTAAGVAIGQCTYEIHDLVFQGNNTAGQVGLHLIANYTPVVRSCYFASLDYGSIGTFCLAAAWRDNRYFSCAVRGAMIQSAIAYDSGTTLWSGAGLSSTPCNVNVFENCRVYGHASQISAFGIFSSNAVRMEGCISEGAGANYDVHFDFQGSTTVKDFWIDALHCEANSKVNLKVRAAGKVFVQNLVRSLPAAICDALGSTGCEINFKGISYLGNMPTATGTGSNPNGRWFYHSDGGGYGGTESGHSSGVGFRFEDCVEDAYIQLSNTAHWENATLPYMLHVRGLLSANNGVQEWSNSGITFGTPIWLSDGNSLAGMLHGLVSATTTSVPANSSVTESFTISGLNYAKHYLYANPYVDGHEPPVGIVWNTYLHSGGFRIRYTNVTGSAISLTSGSNWAYCAVLKA
jgi:hypothetical protein